MLSYLYHRQTSLYIVLDSGDKRAMRLLNSMERLRSTEYLDA